MTRPASAILATLSVATTAANVATSSATGTPAMRSRWTKTQTSTRVPSPLVPATTASSSSRHGTAAKAARFPARHHPMFVARYHHPLLLSPGHLSVCLRVLRSRPVCPATGTGAPFKMFTSQGLCPLLHSFCRYGGILTIPGATHEIYEQLDDDRTLDQIDDFSCFFFFLTFLSSLSTFSHPIYFLPYGTSLNYYKRRDFRFSYF